jgi:hypothetical protein
LENKSVAEFQIVAADVWRPKADGVDGSCSRHQSAKVVEAIKQPRAKGAIRDADYYNRP